MSNYLATKAYERAGQAYALANNSSGSGSNPAVAIGPEASTDGNVVAFDGTTGKLLKDGAKPVANLVTGPASATDGRIATFDGASGKAIKDGGTAISALSKVADVQTFLAGTSTWTKPSGAKSVHILMISPGGGGGSGAKYGAGVACSGGAGGGGGALLDVTVSADILGATETVVIGATGTGGGAVSNNSTAGNPGVAGGNCTFGTTQFAITGGGGGGGGTSGGGSSGGSAGNGILPGIAGASGANGAAGANGTVHSAMKAACGGGAGGGIDASNVFKAGGRTSQANNCGFNWSDLNGGSTDGANGVGVANRYMINGGASGGASSVLTNGGTGGSAGNYGGGGGGGGAARDGVGNSGAGGNGGPGIAIITSYF